MKTTTAKPDNPRSNPTNTDPRKAGVALIISLGLLSVLTILAVAFSISMTVERLSARHFANAKRAEHLMPVAIIRAMEHVQNTLTTPTPVVFPTWAIQVSQGGTVNAPDLISAEAIEALPKAILDDIAGAMPTWQDIVDPGGRTNRIAWAAINAGQFIDANVLGGGARQFSTNINELAIPYSPGGFDAALFYADRADDVRYETVNEIAKLNRGILNPSATPANVMMTYSYDPGRDAMFSRDPLQANFWNFIDMDRPPSGLGTRSVKLRDKFNINSITNFQAFYDPGIYNGYANSLDFMNNYHRPLYETLKAAGFTPPERPEDVVWNIINYLDPDRVPQGGVDAKPWLHTEGGEAIPLINEIVLREVPGSSDTYEFAIELWFPFAPAKVATNDNFSIEVWLYDQDGVDKVTANRPVEIRHYGADVVTNTTYIRPDWSWQAPIPEMEYGTATEFLVYVSPATNRIRFTTGLLGEFNGTKTNAVSLLVRIAKEDTNRFGTVRNVVDEAMGYEKNDFATGAEITPFKDRYHRRTLIKWIAPQGFSVNDARSNGQIKYWTNAGEAGRNILGVNYPPDSATLGATNVNTNPWTPKGQGTPIYMRDDPGFMRNIAELGHIFRSNLDDESPDPNNWWWRTIDLMNPTEGAKLMDVLTVRDVNRPTRGLVAINSAERDTLRTLFQELQIGHTNVPNVAQYIVPDAKIDALVNAIIYNRPYMSFTDMFSKPPANMPGNAPFGGGPLAAAFYDCAPDGVRSGDIYREDTFRHICELITFRQNLFLVIAGAQALAPDGETVVAEKRGIALMYRDGYTGRYFQRSFKWLQ